MSKAGAANPDRRREVTEIPVPVDAQALLEQGARAYTMGGCLCIVSHSRAGWHLSVSHKRRLPSWEELRDARYRLVPDEATMAVLLPPQEEYVNMHEFCMHLWEVPGETGRAGGIL